MGTSQFAHISFCSGIPAPVGMPGEPYKSTSWYALADVVPPRLASPSHAAVGYLWMKGMFDLSQLFVYMLPQSLRRGCGVTHTATWLSLCLCPSVSSGFTHRVSSFCGVFRHSRRKNVQARHKLTSPYALSVGKFILFLFIMELN